MRRIRTDTSHEDTTFSVEIRVDLLLEGGLVRVSGTDSDGKCDRLLLRLYGAQRSSVRQRSTEDDGADLSGNILPNSDGSVDSSSFLEESSDSSSGTLGGAKNDINVGRGDNSGVLGVDEGETVREVESLSLGLEDRKASGNVDVRCRTMD